MKVKFKILILLSLLSGIGFMAFSPRQIKRELEIWYGDTQHVGHLGIAQEDFNLLGHVEPWHEIDKFTWSLNNETYPTPASFRAFRRLVNDGDFNIDIPIGKLKPDTNTVKLIVAFRDGGRLEKQVKVIKNEGSCGFPYAIDWGLISHIQDAGQVVDGKWEIGKNGLLTDQEGYDRIFLIGETDWQNYEVRTSITVHEIFKSVEPTDGGGAVGILFHFTGHTTGGPQHFPSGQPKWGYQPFGGITWLHWDRENKFGPPQSTFYPGIGWKETKFGELSDFQTEKTYEVRSACKTLPDENGNGVVVYSFKLWPSNTPEPKKWDWQHKQVSKYALTKGGVALIAHHTDVTFGNVEIISK